MQFYLQTSDDWGNRLENSTNATCILSSRFSFMLLSTQVQLSSAHTHKALEISVPWEPVGEWVGKNLLIEGKEYNLPYELP